LKQAVYSRIKKDTKTGGSECFPESSSACQRTAVLKFVCSLTGLTLENAGKFRKVPEKSGKVRKTLGKISDYPLIK
jgi:hypothetical protein